MGFKKSKNCCGTPKSAGLITVLITIALSFPQCLQGFPQHGHSLHQLFNPFTLLYILPLLVMQSDAVLETDLLPKSIQSKPTVKRKETEPLLSFLFNVFENLSA
jgi:hypothetical protein